jgi:hypothetical protein
MAASRAINRLLLVAIAVALSLLAGHAHAWCIGRKNGSCPRGYETLRSFFGCAATRGLTGNCVPPADCTGASLNPPYSAAETKACQDATAHTVYIGVLERRSLAAASTAELKRESIKVWKQVGATGCQCAVPFQYPGLHGLHA